MLLSKKKSTAFLSTPSARRATTMKTTIDRGGKISIHALREEGDGRNNRPAAPSDISIHALREEGDFDVVLVLHGGCDFYPRPPRGGRPQRRTSSR